VVYVTTLPSISAWRRKERHDDCQKAGGLLLSS
jgi:hypothetical protein